MRKKWVRTTFETFGNEAVIYLNLCLIRNCDELDKVVDFLYVEKHTQLEPTNEALLSVAIAELKCLHIATTTKDFGEGVHDAKQWRKVSKEHFIEYVSHMMLSGKN